MRLKAFGGMSLDRSEGSELRPRTLGLLAILAAAGANGVTRDRIMAVLWPGTDEDRAYEAARTFLNATAPPP